MTKYPIFLEMQGRKAVVIGGGSVSLQKARVLFDSGARVVIVAEKPGDLLIDFCNKNHIELIRSKYLKEYLNEATLVIAATNKEDVNKMVYQDSQKLGILCNVVDCPQICDFFVPAVLRRNDL
ncbi:MAG: bifunctional precorrin-2 dehydrogenase/sirohydrochlorin ferrochelatase, partial [Planctomycetes bacterium]|nr:bifunctional precorrin-2 dehydrogenase/sirohydrochlorin ferrochelatase [Planctomycetota bacterium]